MNRSIALFVALVILLAHILVIHNDGEGFFAYPYDQAYAVLRLARNFVLDGHLRWNVGEPPFESYPSIVWVGVAALGERIAASVSSFKPYLFLQTVGVLSVLFTVVVAAHFRPDRAAGLIASLILVTTGALAAAAANGLETGLFTFAILAAFWSLEHGYSRRFAIAMAAIVLTRPEGLVVAGGLAVLRVAMRFSSAPAPRPGGKSLWPLFVPAVVLGISVYLRHRSTGEWLSPTARAALQPYSGQWESGWRAFLDACIAAPSLLLLVYPFGYFWLGRLSGTGARALFLALLWVLVMIFQGRSPLPFSGALAPALPLFVIAIQEGMIEALDSKSMLWRRLTLVLLTLCLVASALASKKPGDLGPLSTARFHEAWMTSSGSSRFGYDQALGRPGVMEEIANTNELRSVGAFLNEQVDPARSVLTPWPGAIGYLSRLTVLDPLGRTNPIAGSRAAASWSRRERSDIVAALETNPDFVVPLLSRASGATSVHEIAEAWRLELDLRAMEDGRTAQIERALERFELVTIPVYGDKHGTAPRRSRRFFLLRNRGLALAPKLEIAIDGGRMRFLVKHASHQQIVDLSVRALDERGRSWWLRPNGEFVTDYAVQARRSILLYSTGTRATELAAEDVPRTLDGARVVRLTAVLRNPDFSGKDAFALASEEAVAELP